MGLVKNIKPHVIPVHTMLYLR